MITFQRLAAWLFLDRRPEREKVREREFIQAAERGELVVVRRMLPTVRVNARDSFGPVCAFLRSISRAIFTASKAGGGISAGSTAPNTPSRANTMPARARRVICERAEITNASLNEVRQCRRT